MSFLLKILQGRERRTTERRTRHYQREAVRKSEDPVLYQVKQKLKRHPDLSYRSMSEDELNDEARHLTDPESLKQFFSDITHAPIEKLLQEVSARSSHRNTVTAGESAGALQDTASALVEEPPRKRMDEVGHLTLKLHLSHSNETPSFMSRLGAALLKIPYGVLHAYLEIGDSSNSEFTYIIEFNESSLVQPRRKKRMESTALEATIPLGGKVKISSPVATRRQPRGNRTQERTNSTALDLSYACHALVTPPRERKPERIEETNEASCNSTSTDTDSDLPQRRPRANCITRSPSLSPPTRKRSTSEIPTLSTSNNQLMNRNEATRAATLTTAASRGAYSSSTSALDSQRLSYMNNTPLLQEFRHSVAQYTQVSGEDLTEYVELSVSKMLLIDKLVSLIVQYNKRYYYHSITRNCQTFVIDVLQSFGVWENFHFGGKMEEYLENLNKGRREAYKSHKSVNDRVKYLLVSGEIKDTTYDEARYLRSLYTIFHLEEASIAPTTSGTPVCSDPNCLLAELEQKISDMRPEGATVPKLPEHYV